jgi:hypothetical protein
MKSYPLVEPNRNMCLPCHLQSLLEVRRFYPPNQREIAKSLGFDDGNVVIQENLEPLKSFLCGYSFGLNFFRPFNQIIEPDVFLPGVLGQDVLVGFDSSRLYGVRGGSHFALLSDFQPGLEREVFLHDNIRGGVEQVSLFDLIDAMKKDRQFGFYVVRDNNP